MAGLLGTSLTTDEMWDTIKAIGRGVNLGSTSGLLGGPVDMATMLLNNPGMIHPGLLGTQGLGIKDPVGGSKWIEKKLQPKGLLPKRQGNWQEGAGELASAFLNPVTAAAVAGPKLYAMESKIAENAAAPTKLNKQAGAIVWHGSPHKFDKFDSSKIGTGEGAQAYGHGLYLAESPAVAGQYQKTLSSDGFLVGDKVFDPSTLQHLNLRSIARKGDVNAAIAKAQEIVKSNSPVSNLAAQDLALLQQVKAEGGMKPNNGALYKVDLPDEHIAKMLDWDRPLSQQHPDVQAAMQSLHGKDALGRPLEKPQPLSMDSNGQWAYQNIQDGRNQRLASEALAKAGIPGIRYLDGGSRGTGAGTSNFVVFPGNEDLLRILEMNGQPMGGLLGR